MIKHFVENRVEFPLFYGHFPILQFCSIAELKRSEGTQPGFPLPNPRDSPGTPTDLRKHFF